MGLLGLSLLFVCLALLNNGVGALRNTDLKSRSFLNIVTGVVIVVANFIGLSTATTTFDYLNIASGFLFGFTYIFIAANMLLNLDWNAFAWFSLVVAIYATVNGILAFAAGGTGNILMGVLWSMWAVLWLQGFLEIGCKVKCLSKVFPYLCIFEAIFAAGVPAMLMLFDVWPI